MLSHYCSLISLQCPTASTKQAHLLEGEGAMVCVTFVVLDVETSLETSVERFSIMWPPYDVLGDKLY